MKCKKYINLAHVAAWKCTLYRNKNIVAKSADEKRSICASKNARKKYARRTTEKPLQTLRGKQKPRA